MGDWERTFGEVGMSEGFTGSFNLNPRMVKRMTTLLFETAEEARQWAKEHPGQSIVRNSDGYGFVANVLEWYNEHTGDTYLDCEKEEFVAWEREKETRKNVAAYADQCIAGSSNAGYWLYDNGYRDLLLKLYEEDKDGIRSISANQKNKLASFSEIPINSPLRNIPDYDYFKVQLELRPKLRALLPSPFPEDYCPYLP